jgi:hypothetical protein
MLYKSKTLAGRTLGALDGEIGKVKEFYFDDLHWTIRYVIADTGNWLMERQVLISPYAVVAVDERERIITTDLTKKQIEDSPSLETDKPVSRQFEETYHIYYGLPEYWYGPYMWGASPYIVRDPEERKEMSRPEKTWNAHLRATHEVIGYHIRAEDGEIGHVVDFFIDDQTWTIRYLDIDTRNWWPGKHVLMSPQWIEEISWSEAKVFVKLPCETIKQAPEYKEDSLITRDYETALYGHYNRSDYWAS